MGNTPEAVQLDHLCRKSRHQRLRPCRQRRPDFCAAK